MDSVGLDRKILSPLYDLLTNNTLIGYTILPSIFLSFIAVISINPNTWITSDIHHFYFEMIAVILSAIVAFYCITRAYTLKEKFSLFVGIGFVTITIIDFLHAALSFNAADNFIFLEYFIPQTWFAGRTFLGAMLVIAVVKYAPELPTITTITNPSPSSSGSQSSLRKDFRSIEKGKWKEGIEGDEEEEEKINYDHQSHMDDELHSTLLFPLIMLAVLAISVVVFSFFTIFPGIGIDNYAIHRPYEIPALVLFSIALLYFYKKKIYRINDFFYKGILGALIIDIFGQIIMSFSATNFHTAHNIAHIFKNSGYFIIIVSLAISSIQYNKIAKEKEQVIRTQYEKLKESDKMQRDFINIAAHELRNPIQPILGMTGFLQSKIKDIEYRELLEVTIRNAKRLQRLTEDILDVSRIESNTLDLKKEWFNISNMIENVVRDYRHQMEVNNNYNVRILYESKGDIFVEGDMDRLTQVISNVVDNSLKFTKTGKISINLEQKDSQVIISIKDTGEGINPEILPRLFTKFATKSDKGTGLGLFISKSIIEAHGGKMWAQNNDSNIDENKGATFTIVLPISKHGGASSHYDEK
jgi:signal transduction histidine kinase